MMLPNYDKSILSVTASVLHHYGCDFAYPILPEIERAFQEKPVKNTLLLLFDGMGLNLMKRCLPADAFLNANTACALSTVYPSTTAAATTSLWTGLSPLEHGWLGWSLYFKELGRQLDTFLDRDSFSAERYPVSSIAGRYMPLTPMYKQISEKAETHTFFPFPSEATKYARETHIYKSHADCFARLRAVAARPGEKLLCAYINEPDKTMHDTGVSSRKTKAAFAALNRLADALADALSEDSLIIITADHGLVDTACEIAIDQIEALDECLYMPPCIEARAASFFVKPHMEALFKERFQRLLGKDFLLLSREEALKTQLFGRGAPHKKTDDFIGAFIACALSDKYISYRTPASRPSPMLARHAGLTEDEMLVPLILARGKRA